MGKINFKEGDFITHLTMPNSFAIYGGEELPLEEGDDPNYKEHTLICYYNATQKNSNLVSKPVFDADIDDKLCQYVLSEKDAFWWRRCNSDEKYKALKILADDYKLAWDDNKNKLRRLGVNETLVFDEKPKRTREHRQRCETVTGRVPLLSAGNNTTRRNNETTLRPLKKAIIKYPSSKYKQNKKISGLVDDMKERLISLISDINRRESLSYVHSPYYGGRQPYMNDMYGEFWGD